MSREKRAKTWAAEVYRSSNFVFADKEGYDRFIFDIECAYMQGAKDAENNPLWRMCEDELPYPNEDVLVAFDNGDRGIGYYEGIGDWYVNGIGVVDNIIAWLPLPKFNHKAEKE